MIYLMILIWCHNSFMFLLYKSDQSLKVWLKTTARIYLFRQWVYIAACEDSVRLRMRIVQCQFDKTICLVDKTRNSDFFPINIIYKIKQCHEWLTRLEKVTVRHKNALKFQEHMQRRVDRLQRPQRQRLRRHRGSCTQEQRLPPVAMYRGYSTAEWHWHYKEERLQFHKYYCSACMWKSKLVARRSRE
jgi:hypothetical protein